MTNENKQFKKNNIIKEELKEIKSLKKTWSIKLEIIQLVKYLLKQV